MVKISNKAELDNAIMEAGDKLAIIDFFAEWCMPCKMIAPVLDELAEQYKEKLVVLKIDVDEGDCEALVADYRVQMMPTFVFIRRGEHLDTYMGSNETKLKELIEKFVE